MWSAASDESGKASAPCDYWQSAAEFALSHQVVLHIPGSKRARRARSVLALCLRHHAAFFTFKERGSAFPSIMASSRKNNNRPAPGQKSFWRKFDLASKCNLICIRFLKQFFPFFLWYEYINIILYYNFLFIYILFRYRYFFYETVLTIWCRYG